MKSASKIVNSVLGRLDLHLGRASNFYRLKSEFVRTQGQLDNALAKLDDTLKKLDEALTKLDHPRLLALSQLRWRSDEPDPGLTWGVPMVGDEFVRFLLRNVKLKETSTIVEIGPGYGRILKALLRETIPFKRHIGLEISAARVTRLSKAFSDPRIEFREADVLTSIELNGVADLTFSSAVFEHLYPDFGAAIDNISQFTRAGGAAVVDFIRHDEKLEQSAAWFDKETYMRIYSLRELNVLFEKSGFVLNDVGTISFGQDAIGREITRSIVFATKALLPAGH